VLKRATELGKLVCHDNDTVPSHAIVRDPTTGAPLHYDRQGQLECLPRARIERGGTYTELSFVRPLWNEKIDPFPQHTMLFLYLDANTTRTLMGDTFPGRYDMWRLGGKSEDTGLLTVPPFAGFRRVMAGDGESASWTEAVSRWWRPKRFDGE